MKAFIDKLKLRFRFPFVLAIVAAFLASAGVDPSMLTDWNLLGDTIKAFLLNPYVIGLFCVAVYGIWNNNTVKGLSDK